MVAGLSFGSVTGYREWRFSIVQYLSISAPERLDDSLNQTSTCLFSFLFMSLYARLARLY